MDFASLGAAAAEGRGKQQKQAVGPSQVGVHHMLRVAAFEQLLCQQSLGNKPDC